jgi:hypothetical protein
MKDILCQYYCNLQYKNMKTQFYAAFLRQLVKAWCLNHENEAL